ncbi:MAG: hypothetical protein JXQ72_01165 [Anaerolineae bacterium]|nr:hypothetical protein [Anaerolineae bacterium]
MSRLTFFISPPLPHNDTPGTSSPLTNPSIDPSADSMHPVDIAIMPQIAVKFQ